MHIAILAAALGLLTAATQASAQSYGVPAGPKIGELEVKAYQGIPKTKVAVQLTSDGGGTWTRDGRPDPALDGCTDVDIAGNPFTNAFVTRRVALEIGTETEVRAAFVEPPDLSVRPLVQRYRRLESDRWQYGDDEYGTFEFTTDADGVAVHYERLAERIS